MPDPSEWNRLESIFHGALEYDTADRAEYIRRECAGDEDLRKRVEALLESDNSTSPVDRSVSSPSGEQILGHYRIVSKLGEGGMGVVYLARDIRLDREVALKVVTAERRFLAEAKAASALNHPNIVTVHDVGTQGDVNYLVMEYVPGKPLDRLIPRNGLKVKEALRYAIQIADALACAHQAGIVHRDLKPANVLITETGVAKVVDFGVAKQLRTGENASTLTQHGVILGTAAYMSPEQAAAKAVDARSDIFSFGSVLYEMVTGRRAFQGDSTAAILAAVLREQPEPPSVVADDVPPQLTELITHCLKKDPADRLQQMDAVKAALESITTNTQPRVRQPRKRRKLVLRSSVGILATGIAAVALWYSNTSPPVPVPTPVPLTTYPGFESGATFSPDGTQVAFSWCKFEGAPLWHSEYRNICNIYVKQIGVEPPSRVTETRTKDFSPAWSPDGRWIVFLRLISSTRLVLIRVPQRGGNERVLSEYDISGFGNMPHAPYLAWTPDSRWVVCPTPGTKGWFLSLVATESEEKRILTTPSDSFYGDTAPAVSSDGHTLLFSRDQGGYHIFKLGLSDQYVPHGEPVKLSAPDPPNLGLAWRPDETGIVFASGFGGERGLWQLSARAGIAPQRLPFAASFAAEPAISRRGNRLAYTANRSDSNIWRLDLVGPARQPAAPVQLIASTKQDGEPAPSPDGTKLAFSSERSGTQELWVCNRDGSNPQPLTSFAGMNCTGPQWSPDGQSIVLMLYEKPGSKLCVISTKTGAVRRLSIRGKWPSWSPDGQWIYFGSIRSPYAIWKVPAQGGEPVQITSGADDDMPQVSADGKFVYYNKGWPGPLSIWRVPVDGGQSMKVIDGVSTGGHWTLAKDGLYFFTTPDERGHSEIRFHDFVTRTSKKIATVERTVGIRISVSPDGRSIYYPQFDDAGSDLMLVENFR